MKTKLLFRAILMLTFCLGSITVKGQTFNYECNRIDVWNAANQNFADFIFSYDVVNGFHSCTNNFLVTNNFDVPVSFRFQIFLNGTLTYTGQLTLAARGTYFVDNAYQYCNTLNSTVEIRLI